MKRIKQLVFIIGIFIVMDINNVWPQVLEQQRTRALQFAGKQLWQSVEELRDGIKFPRSTVSDGRWNTVSIYDWTSGFFPGCLWYAFENSRDPFFKKAAEQWTERLDTLQYFAGHHDIGFMMFCSYGNGYRLTKNENYKKIVLQSAKSLTTRFNPKVGCIKSWDDSRWPYPVIIDNMMNLELLFWASQNGGTKNMYDIAVSHAEKTMQNHFRRDGSTYHILGYDTSSGKVLAKNTAQGFADSSCWARGQAWSIYGFTLTYRFTKDQRFLQTAQRAADYFIAHLPADYVPYWDFQAPNIPNEPRDASAAAIAASGLFELSTFVADAELRTKYYETAENILRSLCSHSYLAEGTPSHALLNHCVGHKPNNSEIDVSIIYADYYFLEALSRYESSLKNMIDVGTLERVRVLEAAKALLKEDPVTITAYPTPRSAGGIHDFYSESDYWWPDPKDPKGPYIQRDGMTNPDNFIKHREAMFRYAKVVSTLTSAYSLTHDEHYALQAIKHIKAWCVTPTTKMNPHLLYAQAIRNKVIGRGTGIIDTIHLIEIAKAIEILCDSKSMDEPTKAAILQWFKEYLAWLTTHQQGNDERNAKNNHGTWWVAQVAEFAHLVGDSARMDSCRERFKKVLLPDQMAQDGSFSLELKRTKPYNYSIFNLEGFALICRILSTPQDNLWTYTTADGRSMRKAMEFLYPFILNKSTWPYPKDVMHFENFPARNQMWLSAGLEYHEMKYIDLWKRLESDPSDPEVLRNQPLKQPVLWIN